jgi:transcriptional regulator with XRE-family HTH domain
MAEDDCARPSRELREGGEPIDQHIGRRLRLRRETLGVSVAELSRFCGIAPETLRSMEDGSRRLDVASLHRFTRILQVPVAYFYDGAAVELRIEPGDQVKRSLESVVGELTDRERKEMLDLWYDMLKPESQTTLVQVARLLAEGRPKQ